MTWPQHVEKWKDCQRCPLGRQRGNICLARGTLPCDVLFVGEAPGLSEDVLGQPFVGPAGHRLNQIIEQALVLSPGTTYALTNLVACFPREAKASGHNEPDRGEILECRPRLYEFINLATPRLVVTIGTLAEQYLPHITEVARVNIVHPAAILRMPLAQQHFAAQKCVVQVRTAWEDVVESGSKQWEEWKDDNDKPRREQLRNLYRRAT